MRAVTRTYYFIAAVYTLAASLIWGVNTVFLLDAGLTLPQVFVANAAFSVGTVLFEIPTGVLADTRGRRASFLLSTLVLAIATLAYVGLAQIGAGVGSFAAVSILMGLGFTFYSGAVEAWLVDALTHNGFVDDLDPVFARGQAVTTAAMLVGTVGGGLLGDIDLGIPFVVRGALLAVLFVVAFRSMHDIGFSPRQLSSGALPAAMAALARESVAFGWRETRLRMLTLAFAVQMGFMSWAWYVWQPHFLELLGRDAIWALGLLSALISMASMTGNAVVTYLSRFCGRRTTLLLWGALGLGLPAVLLGFAGSVWVAVPLFLVMMAAMGVTMPVRQSYLHHVVTGNQRATVVSFDSMVAGAGAAGGQLGLGALTGSRSVETAFVVGGLSALLALPLLVRLRSKGTGADRIVGTIALPDACAEADLAAVVQVPRPEPTAVTP